MSDSSIASANEPTTTRNPYVGPRAFTYHDKEYFFGRDREARDLLAHVISQRLLLFYAPSGAGKSSLINTRLVPDLRAAGFSVLPVGRVGGELPMGIRHVDNIFCFNLMLSLDKSRGAATHLAHLPLFYFLEYLASDDGSAWYYRNLPFRPDLDPELSGVGASGNIAPTFQPMDNYTLRNIPLSSLRSNHDDENGGFPYVLIIDQFEELLIHHPDRWQERAEFFRQLNEAMHSDPYLWVVLTLREDYIAGIESYAGLMDDRLRARFYMQHMGIDAAIDAVRAPATRAQHPFAPGVAEQLVNNLSEIRVAGQEQSYPGEFVEPVQLQVVCYQLWQRIQARLPGPITEQDLTQAGNVDSALGSFYTTALLAVARQHSVSERGLRLWFEETLITQDGTRSTVYQGTEKTAGLSNEIVRDLAYRFLLRREQRAGGYWIELSHDRFVDPIRAANTVWRKTYHNPLESGYRRWNGGGRTDEYLLIGTMLRAAMAFYDQHPYDVTGDELDYLKRSQGQEKALAVAAQRMHNRRIAYSVLAVTLIILFGALGFWGWTSAEDAKRQAQVAATAQAQAEENAELANQQLARLAVDRLVQEGRDRKAVCEVADAINAFESAGAKDVTRFQEMEAEIEDTRRQCATQLVREGEQLAAKDNYEGATAKFQAALALEPPSDTPLYVWIEAGEFIVGSSENSNQVEVDGFWLQRTEVTNAQYRHCVEDNSCTPPENQRWLLDQFANQPVTNLSWQQANDYATWVGGRLPTGVEWEYACRGSDGRIYPWGNEDADPSRLNFSRSQLRIWTSVGSYPAGANGLYDMVGNVWEWTSSEYIDTPTRREELGDAVVYTMRGGSYRNFGSSITCAGGFNPGYKDSNLGFRVAISSGYLSLTPASFENPNFLHPTQSGDNLASQELYPVE